MVYRSSRGLATLLVLPLLACTDATVPGSDLPLVSTAAPEFELELDGADLSTTIMATFTNRTSHPVYINPCQPLVLEVRHPGTSDWVRGFDPVIGCPGFSEGIKLDPGEARTDTLHVFGCLDGTCSPNFELVADGEYRVAYTASTEADLSELLPREDRASNAFRIVVLVP
ncbi:MAG TPA: hypothetical protein VFS96_07415 [Nitrolancea sp.]|nr:hypothetical protein [Nitrolancea sp.]